MGEWLLPVAPVDDPAFVDLLFVEADLCKNSTGSLVSFSSRVVSCGMMPLDADEDVSSSDCLRCILLPGSSFQSIGAGSGGIFSDGETTTGAVVVGMTLRVGSGMASSVRLPAAGRAF